jgi:phosphohistidine phosphatase SixA
MKSIFTSRRSVLKILALVSTATLLTACAKAEPDTVVYLVRHAEKVTGENVGKNPALTPEGEARAQALAEILAAKNINHIHSSDFIRTRDTAAPLAKRIGLEVEIYNPRDLPALATKIIAQGGNHLVVGHSDTTPQMTIALGGDGGSPIDDKTEFDRLYEVRLLGDGTVITDLRRYGDGSKTAD